MLSITIPSSECWDPYKEEFIQIKETTLQMEHSLLSVAKWESKWHKAFLGIEQKTDEELRDYFRCMTLTQNVDPALFRVIDVNTAKQIEQYIEDPMTGTTFNDHLKEGQSRRPKEIVTAELIYYWMITYQIPFECQRWHFNRLMMLIRVCDERNKPKKKMRKGDIARRNRSLNAARRARMGTKG